MKQDLDACREAGMVDHVLKPIDRAALLGTLRKWLPASAEARGPTTPEAAGAAPAGEDAPVELPRLPGIDVADALRRLGLPLDSLVGILRRFGPSLAATLRELRDAVAAADAPATRRVAHALAGAAGNLGAGPLREAAKALELAARDGEVARFAGLLQAVEAEATAVAGAIASLGEPVSPAAAPATAGETASPETVRVLLERLRAALDESDPAMASGALGELRALALPPDPEGRLGLVAARLEAYAFDEAIPVVDEWIAGLPRPSRP